ncbi:ABC transporter substrate-binding protein [Candidatus Leptofilum sp.]|uniref:ABC transporter substrate-binding protein n=1 Tax=Candidatus Leptofilum sp. TaxID=3241576 RepID=UPI003B59C069
MKKTIPIFLILFGLWSLAACQNEDALPTSVATAAVVEAEDEAAVTATSASSEQAVPDPTNLPEPTTTPAPPTPTPLPPKPMTICLGAEPTSLFLYGDDSLAAMAVRHALYENLFTTLNYDYQPQGLQKLPSLDEGDARIGLVEVKEGDLIVNSAGNVVFLVPGVQFVRGDGEFITFDRSLTADDAEPLLMQQMTVDFTFEPMIWSDGAPVTAADSVFSYQIAASPDAPSDQEKIERTASYEATGDLTVTWMGLPGFLDPDYFTNVWMPLPQHQLGDFTAAELLAEDSPAPQSLSSGPFVVDEWRQGEALILRPNPNYYRADAGLPHITELTMRFDLARETAVAQITAGCDIATHDAISLSQTPEVLAAAEAGELLATFVSNNIFEHIDFGINSWENYGDGNRNGRPDWFEDVRVRQAITLCTNRQQLVDEITFGQSRILHAYIPDDHPLYPAEAQSWDYDPAAGNSLLDEVGFEDTDGDGFRELVERDLSATIVATTTMSITLSTNSESDIRLRINELVADDLAACGVQVNLADVNANDWFDDGPFSPLFGRRFDMATFAWRTSIRPPCGLYLSSNVTGPEERGFGGWANINATGWIDEEFDAACLAAQDALPGTPEYTENHLAAAQIFTEQLPIIPLFHYLKTAVTQPTVLNFQPDASQPSELWNLAELDIEE